MGLFDAVTLFMKPFSLIKALCILGVKVVCLATFTWLQLVKSFINFQADLCWKFVTWSIALVTLPVRALTAVQREKMLEASMCDMQIQLGNLIWENKDLEERLQIAFKEHKVMETIFTEIEDEHEQALSRIEQLENELQELKDENLRLNEVQGKILRNYRPRNEKDDEDIHKGIPVGTKYGVPSWSPGYDGTMIVQNIFNYGDTCSDGNKVKNEHQDIMKPSFAVAGPYQYPLKAPPESLMLDEVLYQRRRGALSQSVFSAILSLLVGGIIWEAEDPCMPLVAALFVVVGMSLSSVVQFFSTIKNKPASEAIALLSFNWFILGTLTSPTLPRVARVLGPPALRLAGRAFV